MKTPLSHLHDKTGQLKPIKCAATTHAKEKHLDRKVQEIRFGPNEKQQEEHEGGDGDEFCHDRLL